MNNVRAIVLLFAVIVLLAAAHVMVRRSVSESISTRRTTLVDPVAEVVGLSIERLDAESVRLEKTDRWRLVKPYAGTADGQVAQRLVDTLASRLILDTLADSDLERLGRSRADFGLDASTLTVVIRFAKGETRLSFGSSTPSGDGVYVAIAGVDAIYAVPFDVRALVDQRADGFRRRSLFLLDAESVTAFSLKRGGEPAVSVTREGAGWTTKGGRASDGKVREFLSRVTSAEAVEFVWPTGATNEPDRVSSSLLAGYGLDPESALMVTLSCDDGSERRISFGKNRDSVYVYALVQDAGAIVTVPAPLREAAEQGTEGFADGRLFPMAANAVSSFALVDGDVRYALARGADGIWRIEAPVSAAADSAAVEQVLGRILALTADAAGAGKLLVSFSTNETPVAVSREAVLGSLSFANLRAKEILSIAPTVVKRIVRIRGGAKARQTAVLYDRERRAWNVEEQERPGENATVSGAGVSRVLSAVFPLRAVRIERLKVTASDLDDFGLDEPYMTVAIDQESSDSLRRNLIVGRQTPGGRYATVGSSDAVFVISDETVDLLATPLLAK